MCRTLSSFTTEPQVTGPGPPRTAAPKASTSTGTRTGGTRRPATSVPIPPPAEAEVAPLRPPGGRRSSAPPPLARRRRRGGLHFPSALRVRPHRVGRGDRDGSGGGERRRGAVPVPVRHTSPCYWAGAGGKARCHGNGGAATGPGRLRGLPGWASPAGLGLGEGGRDVPVLGVRLGRGARVGGEGSGGPLRSRLPAAGGAGGSRSLPGRGPRLGGRAAAG